MRLVDHHALSDEPDAAPVRATIVIAIVVRSVVVVRYCRVVASTEHSERDVVRSLERGLLVLRTFSRRRRELSIAEIAEAVQLSRPTVRRMLLTLESLGYTEQHGSTWVLTPRVLEIGSGYFVDTSLAEVAQPLLRELSDELGETCNIAIYDRGDVVQLARAEVERIVPDGIKIGTRLPAHATALGSVLLGGLDEAELASFFAAARLDAYTGQTVIEPSAIRARAAAARVNGFAASAQELDAGMIAIAVPILLDRVPIAALGTTSTTARMSIAELIERGVPLLTTTADEISRIFQLGNPHPPKNLSHR